MGKRFSPLSLFSRWSDWLLAGVFVVLLLASLFSRDLEFLLPYRAQIDLLLVGVLGIMGITLGWRGRASALGYLSMIAGGALVVTIFIEELPGKAIIVAVGTLLILLFLLLGGKKRE